jgi:hypothetical protein
MATKVWQGDAATTAQVDTFTVAGSWSAGETLTTTLRAEDDSTVAVVSTVQAGATTVTEVRDEVLSDLQASGNALFTALTFAASSTDAITATADIAGVPFHASLSETGATGTYTAAATTANSGPNDFNVAGNWDTASVPETGDDVVIAGSSSSIFYSLPQNTRTSADLNSLRIAPSFTGDVGQPANGYYLEIDVANGGDVTTTVNSRGNSVWLKGTMTNVYWLGGLGGANAVQLDGDIDNLYVLGATARGVLTVKDATALDNVYQQDAPGAITNLGENLTSLDLIEINSGRLVTESGGASLTFNVAGGTCILHEDADEAVSAVNVRGGTMEYNGSGTLSTLVVYSGFFDLRANSAGSVTVSAATIYGGTLSDRGGLTNVTYTAGIIAHGGLVETDSGYTVAVS